MVFDKGRGSVDRWLLMEGVTESCTPSLPVKSHKAGLKGSLREQGQ
jgi:hypothetical protein